MEEKRGPADNKRGSLVLRPALKIATYLDTVPGNSLSKPPGRGEASIILLAILQYF